ncbi:MAG: MBL fold metallo-hydrolase [Candidatus Omnitrophica bacterium]|nr:MBL fold metallo-hydrolase [Candidatus Omnitrophota bacterium]MDD5429425.1 MBL fold metallo-hydrolase [Candidatus Omnitrophota bacterium]
MKIIFLGTNGWYDTGSGNTTCILIETKNEFIVLDAGGGIYKLDKYIRSKKPIYLFLSHIHLDHIIGLHTLAKFKFSQGIDLYCAPGIKKLLTRVITSPYTVSLDRLKTSIRLKELSKSSKFSFSLEFKKLKHSCTCYGFRFILEGKIIAYGSDTGVCPNLYHLAAGSDLFITECSDAGHSSNKEWPHLNPREAALVAKKSKVKRMVLMHFNPYIYPTRKNRLSAGRQAKNIFKKTSIAFDNKVIKL